MASTIKINTECVELFEHMKTKKTYGYLIFRNSEDNNEIVVESRGNYGAPYDEFKSKLARMGSGFGMVYVKGQNKEALAYLSWVPDSLDMRKKRVHASSNEALKKQLNGATCYVDCSNANDLEFDNLAKRC